MKIKSAAAAFVCAFVVAACGGGSDAQSESTLSAGQSVRLNSGESVKVPSGATVTVSGNSVTVSGDNNTIRTSAGAIVAVPQSATGPADNTIVAG